MEMTYKSLDFIPTYNYVRCLNGDFCFMEVGDRIQNDIEQRFENGEYTKETLEKWGKEFEIMLDNYSGKRGEKAVAIDRKNSRIKVMQAINLECREVAIADGIVLPHMDEADKAIYSQHKKNLEKRAKNKGLKLNYKTNDRIIKRLIGNLEDIIDNSENKTMSVDDLQASIMSLHSLLGINFDEMTQSAARFFKAQEMAGNKVKALNEQQASNGRL